MQSHIRKVYACLAVTCHLHFWQNDRDLLHATAVTRDWTETCMQDIVDGDDRGRSSGLLLKMAASARTPEEDKHSHI